MAVVSVRKPDRGTRSAPALAGQRAEAAAQLHQAGVREAGRRQHLDHPVPRLPRVGREAEGHPAARGQPAPDLAQSCRGVRPHLHGVDRNRRVESILFEGEACHRATAQVHHAATDRRRVPRRRLLDHFLGRIDAGDGSHGCRPGQQLDADARPKPHLQDLLRRADLQEGYDLIGKAAIGTREDDAPEPAQNAFGPDRTCAARSGVQSSSFASQEEQL
jgi:hypothetical protein